MKKILAILLAYTLIIPACSKQDKQDQIETVFENNNLAELRSKPFNPITNDYTILAQKVGYNHGELSSLKANTKFQQIFQRYNLDLKGIEKRTYAGSPIEIIFIPVKTTVDKKVLVVYNLKSNFAFALGHEVKLPDGFTKISYFDTDNPNSLYYEFQVSPQNTLGKFKSYNKISFAGLVPERVGIPHPLDKEVVSQDTPVGGSGCCSKPTFNDCMDCFVRSCGSDWVCVVGCGALNLWCAAAWAAACATRAGCDRAF
jgi:hypothetical protein